jgi:adenine deaminase
VIRVLSDPSFTLEDQETLQVVDGEIPLPIDVGKDLLKLAMIERHGKTPGPNIATGFVRGFEICEGTIGTTIAPDIHQIIVIGSSDEDMAHVANRLVEIQGGIVVCNQGIILAEMSLPIGGIISTLSKQEASEQLGLITHAINSLGCPLEAPLMILAFVGGVGGMPFLKISDKGLVDTMGGNIVPLEIDQ